MVIGLPLVILVTVPVYVSGLRGGMGLGFALELGLGLALSGSPKGIGIVRIGLPRLGFESLRCHLRDVSYRLGRFAAPRDLCGAHPNVTVAVDVLSGDLLRNVDRALEDALHLVGGYLGGERAYVRAREM